MKSGACVCCCSAPTTRTRHYSGGTQIYVRASSKKSAIVIMIFREKPQHGLTLKSKTYFSFFLFLGPLSPSDLIEIKTGCPP